MQGFRVESSQFFEKGTIHKTSILQKKKKTGFPEEI
jgi:hypothetical protein